MKFDYWISHKLSLGKRMPASTVTGVVIAVIGVALSIMVMEFSMGISTGFKHEIRRKVVGFDAPVSVTTAPYANVFRSDDAATDLFTADNTLLDVIREAVPEDASVVANINMQAILKTDNDFAAVECIGRGIGHDFTFEQENIVEGSLPDFAHEQSTDSIVISTRVGRSLGVDIGDRVYLYFFVNDNVKARRMYIAGLYDSNFAEYDNSVVYVSPRALQSVASGNEQTATSIAVEGVSIDDVGIVANNVERAIFDAVASGTIDTPYAVTDITHRGAMYFNWLDLLDTNVVVIFALMLCVAVFTLISSLFIIILDRVPTIGVIRALGASRRSVSNVFVLMALKLVGLGMIIGNAIAISLMVIQQQTHLLPLNAEMYYLSYVPMEINWVHIVLLNVGVAAGAWLMLILPARLAARIDPASTMRYN